LKKFDGGLTYKSDQKARCLVGLSRFRLGESHFLVKYNDFRSFDKAGELKNDL
jgi:hypothetical protein